MLFKLIAEITMESKADATIVEYRLPPTPGGRMCRQVNYMAEVIWASDPANAKVGLKLNHGPNGGVSTLHSTPITPVVPSAVPGVNSGDSDSTKMIGEWLHPVATIQGPSAGPAQRATVRFYELRKPF